MRLTAGDPAPDFAVTDITGKSIKLKDYEHKKLLLCFYRYAGCPFCNVLLHQLIERHSQLHYRGLEIVAFIQSPKESIISYTIKSNDPAPPFPIVADPRRTVYSTYGVHESLAGMAKGVVTAPSMLASIMKHQYPQGKVDGRFLLMPAFFLINTNQQIHKAYYGSDFRDSIPESDIMNFLAQN